MEFTLPLDERDLENIERIKQLSLDINNDMERFIIQLKQKDKQEFARRYFPLLLQRDELLMMLEQYSRSIFKEFITKYPNLLNYEHWDPNEYPDMSWLESWN